ncbi:uncharacterized protein KIAA1755 homolog isoform X6 [Cuculus canorus]|uniref:uncharacterized protein KIAA1755 homolog isoform X6 n=1 Tax=Cuculus canorus TaxID=55661 RepID=UPI0023AB0311|nr:uncharacterized protein KIAA1755 homolog isoform X6 [Cuculus canorus]
MHGAPLLLFSQLQDRLSQLWLFLQPGGLSASTGSLLTPAPTAASKPGERKLSGTRELRQQERVTDAGSLDAAVQSALQALYPPFEATAPTVLGQVFRLLETSYRGDGLCCLLQFLIPAKRLFEHVRQAACAPYFNCIFLHEGWPLCLHEKVVVHLAPLNPLLLRPGDFYLQAEPCEEHTARITVKHLSHDLRTVEETPIPEAAYALLFTNEWLEEINSDRTRAPLHTCLVATENGIAPLPWSKIATPEFIEKPKAGGDGTTSGTGHSPAPEPAAEPAAPSTPTRRGMADTLGCYSNIVGTIPGCREASRKSGQGRYPGLIKVDQAGLQKKPATLAVPSLCEIVSQNLAGEYVDLLDLSQEQLGLLAKSLPPARLAQPMGTGAEGPRLGAAPGDERATSQHEGTWKKVSAIYSPRMGRAKPAGKAGTDAAATASTKDRSLESTLCKNGPPVSSAPGREPPGWQDLHSGLLRSGIMCLPGSSDKLGRALLQVSTSSSAWGATWCSATELAKLILYLCSLSRRDMKDDGLTVVVDARKQPPAPVLFSALRSAQSVSPGCIHTVLLLAEKELLAHRERLPGVQVETLASLKALSRYVDSSQLTQELDGTFPYCHGEWVQFYQKLHPFVAGLRQALELLQSCIRELRSADTPAGMQDVAECIRWHQELMQRVLSDPQLVRVQREGGAVLARLRREAARLSASASIRTSMELAEGLYNQLEEDLHELVSQSNSCLDRLEFLRKVRELKAEFSKLGHWLDGEAAARLQEMGTEEWSPDNFQGPTEQFKEFFIQATAQYQRGLALCQEAAEVRDAAFPEADPFHAAAALFQTKLMSFHRQVERREAEQELLRELGRFSSKITGLKVDCRQCSARVKRGEGQALQCLQSSFQKLSVEFAQEKLQEMKAQVCRMQSSQGLAAWTEARHRYEETRGILEEMLAELQEAWGAEASRQGDALSSPNTGSAAPRKESPVCKGATSPDTAVSEGRGVVEKIEPSIQGQGQPQAGSIPSSVPGVELSSTHSHCPQGLESDCTFHHHIPADTSIHRPESRACQGPAGPLIQERSQPPPRRAFTLPPRVRVPRADPSCPTAAPHSTVSGLPTEKRAEATQYFQVSSWNSFSSEDSDSQNSTEEALAASLASPRDLQGPRQCPSEKTLQIVYLENHHTESPAKENAK